MRRILVSDASVVVDLLGRLQEGPPKTLRIRGYSLEPGRIELQKLVDPDGIEPSTSTMPLRGLSRNLLF